MLTLQTAQKINSMNQKFTLRPAGKLQGMEQSTANLNTSISYNLFNKLKWNSFVIVLGVSMNHLKAQFNNVHIPFGFPPPPPPLVADVDFQKFPPFTLIPTSSQPTYRMGFGLPPAIDAIPLLVEGNIGTNHSLPGTFGTVGGPARWNAIGDRIPLGTLPYISTTGFRSTWENWGMNVGMSQTYSGAGRDALISWQDATVTNPLLATNRLVFGARDGSTSNFEELAQIATQNGTLFGIGIVDPNNPIIPEEQLHLYNFRTPPGFSPLPLYQKWSNDFNPLGARIGYPGGIGVNFQIRNEENANIEFWTNGSQRMTIDNTGWVGIGTNAPIGLTVDYESDPGGWTGVPGIPVANPRFSVFDPAVGGGGIETNGSVYAEENIYFQSDRSLKTDISELENWKRILNLNSYSYKYKGKEDNLYSYGFMAQEVLEVLPEFTSTWRGKGAVNYIGFIPFLTQGLKEHEEKLAEYEEVKENLEQAIAQFKEMEVELAANNEKLMQENLQLHSKIESLENKNQTLESRLADLERKFATICELPCVQGNTQQEEKGNSFGQSGTLTQPASLEQNEPNPFTESTIIRYFIPEGVGSSRIDVRNTKNKVVGSFPVNMEGHGNITISAGTLAAGTYYYSLIINNQVFETKKMVLNK
jgi:hypothetical protein